MLATKSMTRIALFAAVYAALTIALAPISYGPVQFRVSEAMTVLPALFPEAAPGLFIGCFIANLFGGNGALDVIFGSLERGRNSCGLHQTGISAVQGGRR